MMAGETPRDFNELRKLFESNQSGQAPPKRNFQKTRPSGRASWEPKSTADSKQPQPALNNALRRTASQPSANSGQYRIEKSVHSDSVSPAATNADISQQPTEEIDTRSIFKNSSFIGRLEKNWKDMIKQQKKPSGVLKEESDPGVSHTSSDTVDQSGPTQKLSDHSGSVEDKKTRSRTFRDHIPMERFQLVGALKNIPTTTGLQSEKFPSSKAKSSTMSPKSSKSSATWFLDPFWNDDKWDSEESGSGLSIASGYCTDDSDQLLENLDFSSTSGTKDSHSKSRGHLNRSASETVSSQAISKQVHVPARSHTLPNKGTNTTEWDDDAECRSLESDEEALDLSSLSLRERVRLNERLWCKMPEVMQSESCQYLSSKEKALQEVLFELLTSELVYVDRLDVLMDVYYHSKEFSSFETALAVITKEEKEELLLNVLDIRLVANELAGALEKLWMKDPKLDCGMADVVLEFAENRFSCYETYLVQQSKQRALLKTLRSRPLFQRAESRLKARPECMKLDLSAFLLEPFQRLTRYPILLEGILKKLDGGSQDYHKVKAVHESISELVTKCNEAIREQEAIELVKQISESLDYEETETFYFMNPHRRFVKDAEVTQIDGSASNPLRLFLFNDMLFITKPNGEGRYTVLEYTPRCLVEVTVFDEEPPTWLKDNSADFRTACTLVSFKKSRKKALQFHILFRDRSERYTWEDHLTPERESEDGDVIYQTWYERKVEMTDDYCVQEDPFLEFKEGDIILLRRSTADGEFFYGERVCDGASGWFPLDHCEMVNDEVNQAHKLRVLYRRMASFKIIE